MRKSSKRKSLDLSSLILALLILLACIFGGVFSPEAWRSFIKDFSQSFIIDGRYRWLVTGLQNTILMTLIATGIGAVLGLLVSVIRVAYKSGAPVKALNKFAEIYVAVIRGTPAMVQLMIIYYVVFATVDVNRVISSGIAFGINSGAYISENFRAGIEAIDPGQMEAARSLGLSYKLGMTKVVLPQATKNILPTLFNELITLLKETSVAGYIGLTDLTRAGQNIKDITMQPFLPLLAVAVIYLIMVLGLSKLLGILERRLSESDRD